ncbi:MAG: sugar transferase [Fibrella sp.]|nr:sugar transferase [Armatimonadota bacterium]
MITVRGKQKQGTKALTDEQNSGESFAADGGSASAVLHWNTTQISRRTTPVLPDDIGFSSGGGVHHVSCEAVTQIITEQVTAARAQATALPAFLKTDASGDATPPSPAYFVIKRCIDVAISSLLLTILFPVLVVIGLLVALEDRGPVLYYQTRVGRNGRHFRFYKFRSMVKNADALKDNLAAQNEAEGPVFKIKNDPRVTRCGRILRKTSLDELPQLINVLRGEMTLVGPRPHLPREVALYEDWHFERQNVDPGLLCLREVLGRSNLSFDQWVAYDLLYIRNRSARTDSWILLRLIPAVLKADGAY